MNAEITFWKPHELPGGLLDAGITFIRARFLEEWSIDRKEVTRDMMSGRHHIVLLEDKEVAGWLGIESDGELVTGCIRKDLSGVLRLKDLIVEARKQFADQGLYAWVPTEKSESAAACLYAGMEVVDPPETRVLDYPERTMILVKLATRANRETLAEPTMHDVRNQMRKIDLITESMKG